MTKKIVSISKPLMLSLLVGVMVFTFILSMGFWLPSKEAQSQERSLHLHSQTLAASLPLLQKINSLETTDFFLQNHLARMVSLPTIFSATVRDTSGRTWAAAESAAPGDRSRLTSLTIPLKDAQGQELGSIHYVVNWSEGVLLKTLVKHTRFFALMGGIFGFLIPWFFLSGREKNLKLIKEALSQIANGNLDDSLPDLRDQEFKPVVDTLGEMVESLKERDRMRHSLGRIMDPKIAEILIKENPKLGGRRRQATIMFCDIRNYTTICEQMDVDELQKFLNDYWEGTVEIIMEEEGTVDKFHGDGICVIFGAPILHPDDPLRAVRTAWKLVENVKRLNEKRAAERKIPIQIGIGIHSGEVIAGHIGSERRMDYTVVGDVVNVAARIEGLNKKYGTNILISDNVYEKVERFVRVKTLSLAYLRGHKRPILVHALREFLDLPDRVKSSRAA